MMANNTGDRGQAILFAVTHIGKRNDSPAVGLLGEGEYGKSPDGVWFARPPHYPYMANLAAHEVTEHEDGTITVSPSILITGWDDTEWHGYLERGIWRQV